jgi:3-methyl-2-oxobutanoate hydroxymethyltransferase
MSENRITCQQIRDWSGSKPFLALTCYDYPMARLLDEAGVEILHVGDTLGVVVLGYPDTTEVTMADMIRHTGAVARAQPKALITSDLPIASYRTPEEALFNAKALMAAGADAVKMEGGVAILEQVKAVLGAGIPVQGHIGLLPQKIREEKVYRKKGKTEAEIEGILEDAKALQEAGVFSIVIEAVVPEVAAQITQQIQVPTLGIASGSETTGQIRVVHDILGLCPWDVPRYLTPHVQLGADVVSAVKSFKATLKS